MEQYKRRFTNLPFMPFLIGASVLTSLGIIFLVLKASNFAYLMFLFALLLLTYFAVWHIITCEKFRFSQNEVSFLFCGKIYRRIAYDTVFYIIISNAVFHLSYGAGLSGTTFPLCEYRVNKDGNSEAVQHPYITLYRDKNLRTLRKGMDCREIYHMDTADMISVGICWFPAFKELLSFTNVPVYILEDVYLRFAEEFDELLSKYSFDRFFIVADFPIPYSEYVLRHCNGACL